MSKKTAIIIGAGPAGLTAAYELLKRSDIQPIIFESSNAIGGISQTINYKGNRMDIGGHRFFSKSDRVMQWWQNILPLQGLSQSGNDAIVINYQNKSRTVSINPDGPDPDTTDKVMLVRKRLSRIYFLHKFFDYPVSLNARTIKNLGLWRIGKIGISYVAIRLKPIRAETSLEDFMINRFGRELYRTFFKDYTEKVWGVPCNEIGADWGAQRIKGLSISKAVLHAIKQPFKRKKSLDQKSTETSLIEQFMYPKFGPGQMWEEVARQVVEMGGEIHMNHRVVGLNQSKDSVVNVTIKNNPTGKTKTMAGDYFFSTMPVKELIKSLGSAVPKEVKRVADGLQYRDFITVGLLLNTLKISNDTAEETVNNLTPDNWIYIQERDVKIGRLQIFNNWSPYMVKDPNTVWIGLEYFCNEGDELWIKTDKQFKDFAIKELEHIGIIDSKEVLDGTVVRVPKTYPAYFGTYKEFDLVQKYTDTFKNLYLLGRNGMHKYNNADHSMLTAMTAVDNILANQSDKDNIWAVNTEQEYHENK